MKLKLLQWKWMKQAIFALLVFPVLTNAQVTIFNANFETATGNNAWTFNATSGLNWQRGVDLVAHNGVLPPTGNITNSVYSGRTVASRYQNNTNIQATSPLINFSGYENITLSIDTRTHTETNDGMKVQYQLNGGAWQDLGNSLAGWYDGPVASLGSNGWFGGNTNSQWVTRSINISAQDINFNGNDNVRFRVVFTSNTSVTNIGVAFDNFVLTGFPVPEIVVTGDGNDIVDGSLTTSHANFTDFGGVLPGNPIFRTFEIRNTGFLNLTLGAFTFSGPNAAEFTLTSPPAATVIPGGSTTFTVRFIPTALGTRNATISFVNNDSNENPFDFALTGLGGEPEISITGLGNNVPDNASASNPGNGTNFGNVAVGSSFTRTFTIRNTGNAALVISSVPLVQIFGDAEFTVTTPPASTIAPGATSNFVITFNPTTAGGFLAIVNILNNDSDEGIYDFVITGNGTVSGREIDLRGNDVSIADEDTTPSTIDLTDFGDCYVGMPISIPFIIRSVGSNNLTVSSIVRASGSTDFTTTTMNQIIGPPLNLASFVVTFTPTTTGTFTAVIRINNNSNVVPGKNEYNFTVRARVIALPTIANAPGGVTNNLRLWLKADQLAPTTTTGSLIANWQDNALGSTRSAAALPALRPTFYNAPANNLNFNPVVSFTNSTSMYGGQGFNNHDLFIVMNPRTPITRFSSPVDLFCGDDTAANPGDQDVTGIALGASSDRYTNEVIAYNQAANTAYGIAQTTTGVTYSVPIIINAGKVGNNPTDAMRLVVNGNNVGGTVVNAGTYKDIRNTRYWLGRSEFFGPSLNGDIMEVISYDRSNSTAERARIESYLAIKYGITLGTNGTSVNYTNSAGTTVYNAAAGYNWDIAGIGRDDASQLNQKQSKTINKAADITMGLGNILPTNSANTNTFAGDRRFLIWGNDNASLAPAAPLVVNISAGVTPALTTEVDFIAVQRIWRVIESGGDVGTVKVSIPATMLTATLTPPGDFYMFISDTPVFTPTAEYRVMTPNGSNLETFFDFNGTKYITFGYAPERTFERCIEFNGTNDFINSGHSPNLNLGTNFTVSAWVKRGNTGTILSKRNNFTEGYDLRFDGTGRLQMRWLNGATTQTALSNTVIPTGRWHYVAVTYDGTNARIYIDGVLDRTQALAAPSGSNTHEFLVGAANAVSPGVFYQGGLDEIRLWNVTLTEQQLRFIMNQEIDRHTDGTTYGLVIPQNITSNDVATLPWANLALYYPMSTYTYTNVKDKSENNITGALKNLTTVDRQTAPLPHVSSTNGNWNTATTWLNNTVNVIPHSPSIVNPAINVNWNIVRINSNVTTTANRDVLGLFVNSTRRFNVQNDTKIDISHYLLLDGTIDLVGRSQLVQRLGSDLNPASTGVIERDQQGSGNVFNYNYWSSPVSTIASTTANNTGYSVRLAMHNGTTAATPTAINFVSGVNGSTSPFSIARRWLYKFTNLTPSYANWQQLDENSTLQVGQGYTMKGPGVAAPPAVSTQNYVYIGKPNNGLISSAGLAIGAGSINLIGNPYPSAIDATQFINDNLGAITGTLYFWEHYPTNNSHNLAAYQGGYATRTIMGGVAPVSPPLISGAGSSTRVPQRFIPVGQAFFVIGSGSGGTIAFNNNQRSFVKEDDVNSNIMFRQNETLSLTDSEEDNSNDSYIEDTFKQLHISYEATNSSKRQLLLGFTNGEATNNYDNGYDARLWDMQESDVYFPLGADNLVIQAEGVFSPEAIYPVTVKSATTGTVKFVIDQKRNFDVQQPVYLYDAATQIYHDLSNVPVSVTVEAGITADRFSIRFMNETLSNDDFDTANSYFYHHKNQLVFLNSILSEEIKSVSLYNVLGQKMGNWKATTFTNQTEVRIPTGAFAKGVYIVNVTTSIGAYTKKIIIE